MAHLLNSIHAPHCTKQARSQSCSKPSAAASRGSLFQWFFAGGEDCGFHTFPTFGLTAYRRGLYFDFSMANVGVGMISPYKTTMSMLVGSLVSWGIIWPYIETKEGSWYPRGLDGDDLGGINGYRVFVGMSMILADGLLHLLVILLRKLHVRWCSQQQAQQPFGFVSAVDWPAQSFDDRRRKQVFVRGRIPNSAAVAGYVVLSVVSTIVVPRLYTELRYHHVAVAYLVVPVVAFCNAYVNGVTDMNIATT
ncbi:hypothetical protein E2562_033764 [Oryza meyeriana var. granulata]|nr:hypothetical protein E2562_033764 [Oryza meyeriana var. granulata]